MKRKNRIRILLSVLATTFVMACSDSYPSLSYEEEENNLALEEINNDKISGRTQVLMFVNPQALFTISTRGTGLFPPKDAETYGPIHIFAFRDGKNISGTELTNEADFRKTAYATTNNASGFAAEGPDNGDCLVDGEDYLLGLPTTININTSGQLENYYENKTEQPIYYYSNKYQETPYNFFAYYIDDLSKTLSVGKVKREAHKISYDIQIDGYQDIMCGTAPKLTDSINNTLVLFDRYKDQVRGLRENNPNTFNQILNSGYSKFSADRGIHPYIDLDHQLVQLQFKAFPADETSKDIIIEGINVICKARANMTVASRDLEADPLGLKFYEDKHPLKLFVHPDSIKGYTDDNGTEVRGYRLIFDKEKDPDLTDYEWQDQPQQQIGEQIFVSPDSMYEMEICYRQKYKKIKESDDGIWSQTQITKKQIRLSGADRQKPFEAGKIYTLYIAVYGQKEIQVFSTFEDWKVADDEITPIDFDDSNEGWESWE